ncbi:AsmA-like C-terminal region-containing protein, partial [Candidatus Pelagibacter sp.]|nr:AsmA-like C-terminal region-containing protein [Candidatus Pelagibacter sp.]
EVHIDNINTINNLNGHLKIKNNKVHDSNILANFNDKKILTFTIKTNNNKKVTTLYSSNAKPFVKRYKFIKGFEEGDLNFYSTKKNNISNSVLKIDNFKVQEVPALAKLLSLASLQGIADLLTGEGIRFTNFEMDFSNKKDLMTVNELYAIGPSISILMDGYIQSNNLISLRGTLVPATTINKTIASIPLLGNLLIGKKVGEGVFGVSFKIKGPPKDLKTTVNPIKTLTPRFITRTLEKLKKTN